MDVALTVKVMGNLDTIRAQYDCTRQEARYYALGYAQARGTNHAVIDILRELIENAKADA